MGKLEIYDILRSIGMSNREVQEVSLCFSNITLKKGDSLLKLGQVSKTLYFVESGVIKEAYLDRGREIVTSLVSEGYFVFSISSFLLQETSKYYIKVVSKNCVLQSINISKYYQLLDQHPKPQYLQRITYEKYLIKYEKRLELLRSFSAKEKYLNFLESESELSNRIPIKDIASYLAIDPTTLSRVRKSLVS